MRTREEREKTNDLIMDVSADAGESITVSHRHRVYVCLHSHCLLREQTKNSVVLF